MDFSDNQELLKQFAAAPTVELRNQIATRNDKLALKIAHRCAATTDTPLADLEQLARQGLLKAIERFDPKTGNALSSFAVPYIRGEIQHYLRDQRLIRVPRTWQELRDRADRVAKRLTDAGRLATIDDAAAGLGLSSTEWEEIKNATSPHLAVAIEENVAIEDSVEESEESDQLTAALCEAIGQLPPLQRTLITESFWGGLQEKHLAIRHGLTRAQVRQEIQSAIGQLQKMAQ